MESVDVKFSIQIQANPKEDVWIVGDCKQLGNWNHSKAVLLNQQQDRCGWYKEISLPKNNVLMYRYFTTVALNSNGDYCHVLQRLENHALPRSLELGDKNGVNVYDEFGIKDGVESVINGLSTSQKILTLKFKPSSVQLWKKAVDRTTLRLTAEAFGVPSDDVKNTCKHDGKILEALIETAIINKEKWRSCHQEKCGVVFYPEDDFVIVKIQSFDCEQMALKVTLSEDSTHKNPSPIGVFYILPDNWNKTTQGSRVFPITSPDQQIVGKIHTEFFLTTPFPNMEFSLEKSYVWDYDKCLKIGHRGSGASSGVLKSYPPVLENTVSSFQLAYQKGYDFVELDVQLSKDSVPVIYHDFNIGIDPRKDNTDCKATNAHVMDLTYDQLSSYKLLDSASFKDVHANYRLKSMDKKGQEAPFPTLEKALKEVDPALGFNIEIKVPSKQQDGSHEVEQFWDNGNHFLDEILSVVFKHAKDRKIVFSCFNSDSCTMLRLKQNIYPVLLLICGKTKKYPPLDDPRSLCIENAICSALNANLQGIVAHGDELLSNSTLIDLVHKSQLLLFSWGDSLNDKIALQKLIDDHVDGVIHDWLE